MANDKEKLNQAEEINVLPKKEENPAVNLDWKKLQEISKEIIQKMKIDAEKTVADGSFLLNKSLDYLAATPAEKVQGQEAIAPANEEIKELADESEKEVKEALDKGREGSGFDRKKFLADLKSNIEKSGSPEELIALIVDAKRKQKDREDLNLLFDNFKFIKSGYGKKEDKDDFIHIKDYFEDELKDLLSADSLAEIKAAPLADLKKEILKDEYFDEIIPPTLRLSDRPEDLDLLKKIQSKFGVEDFYLDDFIGFINNYKNLTKEHGPLIDKFIFKDFPKKKDEFMSIKDLPRSLSDNPSDLEKIDFINSSNLNKDLNLFDGDNYYEFDQESWNKQNPDSYEMPKKEKGVDVFEKNDAQSERLQLLDKLSLDSLKIAKDNKYFKIQTTENPSVFDLNINLITEERLKEIYDFTGPMEKLSPLEVAEYAKNIENLPPAAK